MSEVPESILSEADRQLTEQGRHRLNPKWPLIKLADKDETSLQEAIIRVDLEDGFVPENDPQEIFPGIKFKLFIKPKDKRRKKPIETWLSHKINLPEGESEPIPIMFPPLTTDDILSKKSALMEKHPNIVDIHIYSGRIRLTEYHNEATGVTGLKTVI